MKIRNKILLYFSTTTIALTILSSLVIYFLFSEYRQEEFQQRQKEKIKYTLGLIAEYKDLTENLTAIMDKHTIHDFYDEKMLIYDKHKTLIYQSVDDLPINNADNLLNSLSPAKQWVETKEDKYDIIAVYIQNEENHFYAISKAYDAFGYTKLAFLRNVLIAITAIISIIVLLVTVFLSKRIAKPITEIAEQLGKLDIANESIEELQVTSKSFELKYLITRFNQLIQRTNEAFAFQKHTIHHISHQLKTPVAVLVSELERIEKKTDSIELKTAIETQIVKTKSLGNIINTLLEISKIESAKQTTKQTFRIDELIFDIIAELNIIYPDFKFEVNYTPKQVSETKLAIKANEPLIKQAFLNILTNCITYSDNAKAEILFDCSDSEKLIVFASNSGIPISIEEEKFLFNHFFRGQNSQSKTGFGLGLVLVKRIFEMHNAKIAYSSPDTNLNIFETSFPLS
ncbi:sensor histidine kinase [Raineya orbicola]|uniref:histidine kinase n=1 Tax=Raineya orbicola TaxID=2016530 RepID=A0A2N3I6M1_9BACT|nr:HAMP domain-containing sensor histidine kinase [Raineya orbicola]PKQ65958.1 Histidine kinase-, DNA gyrase B-, and HSP90-like ATPase [Raineya orbicola]